MVRELCGTFGRLPGSCLINEDLQINREIPFAASAYADLWKGNWNGKMVAVKALRCSDDDDKSGIRKVVV